MASKMVATDGASSEAQVDQQVVYPVFIKHTDLGLTMQQQLKVYDLSKELFKTIAREDIDGVQRVRGLWRIYVNTQQSRIKLLTEGVTFKGIQVTIYDQNPFRTNHKDFDSSNSTGQQQRTVKVTISNLPLSVGNEEVAIMMKRMGTLMKSDIAFEYARDDENKLTSVKTGNRTVLVDEKHLTDNPLPRFSYCNNFRCNIFYRNQPKPAVKCFNCGQEGHMKSRCLNERICKACKKPGHVEGNEMCEFHLPNNAQVFAGTRDKLSSFYPCRVVLRGKEFPTAEHAYVHEKATQNNRSDIATTVLRTQNVLEVKKMSNKIVEGRTWKENKVKVMKAIVESKTRMNDEVRKELIESGVEEIGEAVIGQDYWGIGISKEAAAKTNPSKWPGKNILGNLYMELRENLKAKENSFTIVGGGKRKASSSLEESKETPTSKPRPSGTTPEKDEIYKMNALQRPHEETNNES